LNGPRATPPDEPVDAKMLPGARKTRMPAGLRPMLATLVEEPFSHPDWLFEIKWDGVRALAWIRDGHLELHSRTGRAITRCCDPEYAHCHPGERDNRRSRFGLGNNTEEQLKSKLIQTNGGKTYAVIFDEGDEVSSGLVGFAKQRGLGASHFTAIGGFREVVLGYYDLAKREYKQIPVKEQVEALSLVGDIALEKGEPKVHAHVVVGTSEGQARGGHLIKGYVRPTLELVITESPKHLHREYDAASGLALIRI
jgi:uncharacterized protein